jgi:hypothetical protein
VSVGDIIVYAIALAAFAFLVLLILARWREFLTGLTLLAIGIPLMVGCMLALGVVISVAFIGWQYLSDRQTFQQCLTAYERRARAYATPADYFGEQLRAAAVEEERKCAEFAARKQAH